MTTVTFLQKKCFLCGHESRQADIGVRDAGEARDLDYRPGGVGRSSIYMWVQRCLSCGYCAPDITHGDRSYQTVVEHPAYRKQLTDGRYPDTVNAFLCWAMIKEFEGNHADAARAMVAAAWVCDDDAEHRAEAREFRNRALEHLARAASAKQRVGRTPVEDRFLAIDLHRRVGRFKQAAGLCEEELERRHDKKTIQVLTFQQDLIERGDKRSHAIAEAIDPLD